MSRAKKLVLVLATSTSMTDAREEALVLKYIPYIYYPIRFKKNKVQALFNSSSEVNAMTLPYISKLGLRAYHINIRAQKIDGSTFQTFGMVLASFQVEDKLGRTWFFQETFLLANISAEVVLGLLFLTFSNADV